MNRFKNLSRRQLLKASALGGVAMAAQAFPIPHAAAAEPIRLGLQWHGTGIGAPYGRWYKRTAQAAVKLVNELGGINGRPVELIMEDDATDPKRGAEVMAKLDQHHKCEVIFGGLFSHVVIASAQPAGELKVPYFICSEGHHVASGILNRYCLQPGITDVKSQVISVAPWIVKHLGKRVAMIFPDYAFGYDHRDNLTTAIAASGGEVVAKIAIPPTETSFTRYFPRIPKSAEVIYHVMVGPSVLNFARELGEFYSGGSHPALFGFIDSLESVDMNSPGLEFLRDSYFWEGHPRYLPSNLSQKASDIELFYRSRVGVDRDGAAIEDSRNVSSYGHMFSCWESVFIIKRAMEACGYRGRADRAALIEAVESFTHFPYSRAHPQGEKTFNGRTHQAFGLQYITQLEKPASASSGRLVLRETLPIELGYYADEVDYTRFSF